MSADATLRESIKTKLTVQRAGNELGLGLVEVLINHFVENVCVKDEKEVVIRDLLASAEEAWLAEKDTKLPAAHKKKIVQWVANVPVVIAGGVGTSRSICTRLVPWAKKTTTRFCSVRRGLRRACSLSWPKTRTCKS